MRILLFASLITSAIGFYMKNTTGNGDTTFANAPRAAELRSKTNSIELFGQRMEVPDWVNSAAEKTRGMFDSASNLFGKDTATSRKSQDGLMTNLKKDESTRIWFAVYLNILVVVLIYVFITIKLALLSLSEGQMERKKRNAYSSHVAFDGPDYNLPLTSIATKTNAISSAPMSIDNPMPDFEYAREAQEDESLHNVTPLDFDAIPSSERNDDRSF
ncbi:Protein CBG09204 [Caenorhabditis briggsae]|uniref:Uncharacterized protein n=3 Tax=Caenorhabditis briggsae TaxID=6238 RepID=A0AAE9EMT3_CAEBR|nr:Protein CBG09204 [Caenorhabditis briggsae]UMM24075.1 hypothetical protein L5515_004483 [Caenorhabditis briggsae]CAP28889.1 Protein CBG09204 [Caenorhabditis briggsae]